jgi:chorismate dehydratase
VFAAWIARAPLPHGFVGRFNEANAAGITEVETVAQQFASPHFNLLDYYTKFIDYRLDDRKREGLALFLKKLRALEGVPV